jgi:hypothetical protein
METLYRLARGGILPRLLVGALVAFFLYAGMTERDAVKTGSAGVARVAYARPVDFAGGADHTDRLIELAKTDHLQLLRWALDNYETHIRDYTARFHKQERIKGKLRDRELIDVSFREAPFSVLMTWRENAGRVDKLLYVEGSNDGQMIVHPTGLFSWISSVKRDPRGDEAYASSLRTCDQFGFCRTMESLLEVYEQAQERGELETAYLGETLVDGRPCVAMERVLPPDKGYPYARIVIEIDTKYLVPVATACYDWRGQLISRYAYHEIVFNQGLTPEQFTPGANGF